MKIAFRIWSLFYAMMMLTAFTSCEDDDEAGFVLNPGELDGVWEMVDIQKDGSSFFSSAYENEFFIFEDGDTFSGCYWDDFVYGSYDVGGNVIVFDDITEEVDELTVLSLRDGRIIMESGSYTYIYKNVSNPTTYQIKNSTSGDYGFVTFDFDENDEPEHIMDHGIVKAGTLDFTKVYTKGSAIHMGVYTNTGNLYQVDGYFDLDAGKNNILEFRKADIENLIPLSAMRKSLKAIVK